MRTLSRRQKAANSRQNPLPPAFCLLPTAYCLLAVLGCWRVAWPAASFEHKVIVVVSAHAKDYVEGAGGAIAKAIREGATVYLVRVTNDEKQGYRLGADEARVRLFDETRKSAAILGIKQVIDLDLKDGEVAEVQEPELRSRLAAIYRKLAPDAIFTSDPWSLYDPDLDDQRVARAAEDACWNAASMTFYPELFIIDPATRFQPITDRYFWTVNGGWHPTNELMDISATMDQKLRALETMPTAIAGEASKAAARLARAGRGQAPWEGEEGLGRYVDRFYRAPAARLGRQLNSNFAEGVYHYKAANPLDAFRDWLQLQRSGPEPAEWKPPPLLQVETGKGRKVVVVTPEAADWVVDPGGTVARMVSAGFEVYLVRVGNDEKSSAGRSGIESQAENSRDLAAAARLLGVEQVFDLGFRQGELGGVPLLLMRDRLLWILRSINPHTVLAPDPWERYTDRETVLVGRITADAVYHMLNQAVSLEQSELTNHALPVVNIFYWQKSGANPDPQSANSAIDTSAEQTRKESAVLALHSWLAAQRVLARELLRAQGLQWTWLSEFDADRKLVEIKIAAPAAQWGRAYGVRAVELFHVDSPVH